MSYNILLMRPLKGARPGEPGLALRQMVSGLQRQKTEAPARLLQLFALFNRAIFQGS